MAYNLLKYFLYSLFFLLEHLPFSLFFFFSLYFSLFPRFTYSSYEPSYGCPEAVSWGWVGVCVCVCVCVCVYVCVCAHAQLCLTLWPHGLVALQAPLSMEFSRQEYWSGLPFPTPGDIPDPGIKLMSPVSPAVTGRFFTTEPPGLTFKDSGKIQWPNRYGLHTGSRKNYTGANLSLKHCHLFISFPF